MSFWAVPIFYILLIDGYMVLKGRRSLFYRGPTMLGFSFATTFSMLMLVLLVIFNLR